jgi:hypothetical protein
MINKIRNIGVTFLSIGSILAALNGDVTDCLLAVIAIGLVTIDKKIDDKLIIKENSDYDIE